MYEALEHSSLIGGCLEAAEEAWIHETAQVAAATGMQQGEVHLLISEKGWAKHVPEMQTSTTLWLNRERFQDVLTYMLDHLYILNGGILRKQVKGVPMGLCCAGQMANAYGYAIESRWVDRKKPRMVMSRRYIDDIFTAGEQALQPGAGLPSEEEYQMKYKVTSDSTTSLIYIGVRLFVDEKGEAHTVLHDRAMDYRIPDRPLPRSKHGGQPSATRGRHYGALGCGAAYV